MLEPNGSSILLTEYGDDEGCFTFKHREWKQREFRENCLLVKVAACGVSYLDLEMKKGIYKKLHGPLPHVLGYEVAGEVYSFGEDVTRFSIGDLVVGFIPVDQQGGNSDFVIIEEQCLGLCYYTTFANTNDPKVLKPKNISFEEAAGSITAGIRAETALHSCSNLTVGDSILIVDGNLFDQQLAIQLALFRGLSVFTTITNKETEIPSFILDNIQVINLSEEELSEAIAERTSGLGVDVILESPSYFAIRSDAYKTPQMIKCLASHGTWITSRSIQVDPPASHILLLKSAKISYVFEQTWVLSGSQQGRFLHLFVDFMERLEQGDVRCTIDKTFKMDRVTEAHSYFLSNFAHKIILLP